MSNFDKLFGRTYSTVGNSDSDFIIKTRGQVKVQWGKKFIDIIKDGKLNVDTEVIKKISNSSKITSDGIYYVEDTKEVVLRVGGVTINLSDDGSGTFVSYAAQQDTSPEQREMALGNIGIRCKSKDEAIERNIVSGIVFLDETEKWYVVKEGVFSEYVANINNPYTDQIVIKKSDNSQGALVIQGNGRNNSIAIGGDNGILLYRDGSTGVISNSSVISIRVGETSAVTIDSEGIIALGMSSNMIKSEGATQMSGFRLYTDATGKSTLEVDNLSVRESTDTTVLTHSGLYELITQEALVIGHKYRVTDFQNEWELTTDDDIIESTVTQEDSEQKNVRPLIAIANTYTTIGSAYYEDNPEWKLEYDASYIDPVSVVTDVKIYDENGQVIGGEEAIVEVPAKGRITKLTDEKGNSCNYDFKHLKFKITEDGVDKWIYTFRNGEEDLSLTDTCRNNVLAVNNYEIKSETITVRDSGNIVTLQGTLTDNNFGTINSNFNFSGTANKLNVSGILENVTFKEDSTIDEVAIRSLTNVTFNESFSRTTFHSDINDVDFDTTVYALLYNNEKIKDVYYNNNTVSVICIPDMSTATSGIPAGTIVMYNGTSGIPAGWAICDGTEGTPNLTGNFIKASETAGETGEFIPASSDSSTETPITYYSLVFIMKLA